MTKRGSLTLVAAIVGALTAACSSSDPAASSAPSGSAGAGGGSGTGGGAGAGAAAGAGGSAGDDGWITLATGTWTIPPSSEHYYCARATVTADTYVGAFRNVSPTGTHHTVVTLDDSGQPDGMVECDSGTGGPNMITGSGVGTPDFVFPPGIAVKIKAGQQVLVNLHLFNTGSSDLSGTSGTMIKRVDPASVVHEAEIVLAGKALGLVVPPGTSTQTGTCTMPADVTIFAAAKHMHKLGTHLKTTAMPAGGAPIVLLDEDYSFDDQTFAMIPTPVALKAGDTVTVECSYDNRTSGTVKFGHSTTDEMCFSGLVRYPVVAHDVACVQ